jgi:hypothetical protein
MQKNIVEIMQKIEWTDVKNSNTLVSVDGWELSYSIDLHYSSPDRYTPSVQMIFRLVKNGVYVMTWGCSNDDQSQAVNAFLDAKNKAYNASADVINEATTRARALLVNL